MGEAFDNPGGLEIDEDGVVIGGVIGGKHAGDAHAQRVDARKIEDILR